MNTKLALVLLLTTSLSASIIEESPSLSARDTILAETGSAKPVKVVNGARCGERGKLEFNQPNNKNYQKRLPALGYDYETGPEWPILCKNTKWGTVAGRYSKKKKARFGWGLKNHRCREFSIVYGELVHRKAVLPSHCSPQAYQTNDKNWYYNIIVVTENGMIPGKAQENLRHAWYSNGKKELAIKHDNYYIVC